MKLNTYLLWYLPPSNQFTSQLHHFNVKRRHIMFLNSGKRHQPHFHTGCRRSLQECCWQWSQPSTNGYVLLNNSWISIQIPFFPLQSPTDRKTFRNFSSHPALLVSLLRRLTMLQESKSEPLGITAARSWPQRDGVSGSVLKPEATVFTATMQI